MADRVAPGDAHRVERFVVVDGVAGPAYARITVPPWFSADSAHVAYVADRGGARVVVVDRMEGKPYGCIRGHPVLTADGSQIVYGAVEQDDRFEAAEEVPYDATRPLAGGRLVLDRTPAFDRLFPDAQKKPIKLMRVEEKVVQE